MRGEPVNVSNIWDSVKDEFKNVKKNTKKKINKKFMNKLQRWSYRRVTNKLERFCEENGILLTKINPAYTSQTCSKCGAIHKNNRLLELFKCIVCGYEDDADYNASVNISRKGVYNPFITNKYDVS